MSDRRTVLLPEPIEKEALQLLQASGVEIVTSPDPKPDTVKPLMARADAIVLRTGIKITADLLAGADRLMTISRTGAGVDNVDLAAATRAGVIVSSSAGANTTTVAEHALALVLATYKHLPALDREFRKGNFKIRYAYLPRDLRGKTLGVVGFGKIGSELARACQTVFGMTVVAFDAYLPDPVKRELSSWVTFTTLDEVLRRADVVSVHAPLTDETRGLIGRAQLALMKREAVIVNTARGGIIDEAALADALRSKAIAGAGIDVFEQEPPPRDNPLLGLDNIIVTPHTAALTQECVVRLALLGAQRAVDVLEGYLPDNVANPQVLGVDRWKHLRRRQQSNQS
jgi:D-3-phosphoglycerate dehydrogenase / 2-oxoglutarate reductase